MFEPASRLFHIEKIFFFVVVVWQCVYSFLCRACSVVSHVRLVMPNRRKWSRTHSLLSLHHLRASNRVACPWAVADCGTVSPLQLSTTVRAGGVQDLVCFQVHQCCGDEVLVMKHEGDALQYKGDNKVVMMPWERAYMEACVDAMGVTPKVRRGGHHPSSAHLLPARTPWVGLRQDHVLEIGFGCGYSADRIQSYHPRSHTIVECSVAVLRRLHRWAASKPGIVIVEGTWQRALPHLGRFDAIFFDDFPLPADGAAAALTHDDAAPPAPTHNATLAPPVVTPSYPGMGHRVRLPPARLRHPFAGPCPDFTDELLAVMDTRWSALLGVCVQWHLRVGGRMTGYLARDCVLSHPRCDYSVAPFSVQVRVCSGFLWCVCGGSAHHAPLPAASVLSVLPQLHAVRALCDTPRCTTPSKRPNERCRPSTYGRQAFA